MPYNSPIFEFIETPTFTRNVANFLDDDEYASLQNYLNEYPGAGAVIPGSGGVRKLRWRGAGHGKRGGLRIIYYLWLAREEIWMLSIYGKNMRDNISAHILKIMREAIEHEKDD